VLLKYVLSRLIEEMEKNGTYFKDTIEFNNFLLTAKSGMRSTSKNSTDLKNLLRPALSETKKSDMVLLDTELLTPLGNTTEFGVRQQTIKDFASSMYVSGEKGSLSPKFDENQNFMSAHAKSS